MPRAPLSPISGNRPRKSELKPYERGTIVGAQALGHTPTEIVKALNLSNRLFRPPFRDSQGAITAYLNHDLERLRFLLTAIDVTSSIMLKPIHGSLIQS